MGVPARPAAPGSGEAYSACHEVASPAGACNDIPTHVPLHAGTAGPLRFIVGSPASQCGRLLRCATLVGFPTDVAAAGVTTARYALSCPIRPCSAGRQR